MPSPRSRPGTSPSPATTIKTYPSSVPNLTLLYYQTDSAALVEQPQPTGSWLRKPQAYLYGSLVHAAPFLDDDDRMQVYAAMRKVALDSLRLTDYRGPLWQGRAATPGVDAMTGKIIAYYSQRDHRGAGGHPGHPAG